MELKYDYWTGTLNQVLESLNRSIGQSDLLIEYISEIFRTSEYYYNRESS